VARRSIHDRLIMRILRASRSRIPRSGDAGGTSATETRSGWRTGQLLSSANSLIPHATIGALVHLRERPQRFVGELMSAVTESRGPRDADRQFFSALLAGDVRALEDLLSDDFTLIDVLQGGEISRTALLEAVSGGVVRFEAIDVLESRERRYGNVSLVTGRT